MCDFMNDSDFINCNECNSVGMQAIVTVIISTVHACAINRYFTFVKSV